MSIYFIKENKKMKKRDVNRIFLPLQGGEAEIPPLYRLNEKRRQRLIMQFSEKKDLFFSDEETEKSLPEIFDCDTRPFFTHILPSIITSSAKSPFARYVLSDADFSEANFFLSHLSEIYLTGDDAHAVSRELYFEIGASVPVLSEPEKDDAVIFFGAVKKVPFHSAFAFCRSDCVLSAFDYSYFPEGKYEYISSHLSAPLTAKAAARLWNFDNNAHIRARYNKKSYI